MDLVTAAVSIGGAFVASGGVGVIVNAIAKRRTDKAEVTVRLNEAAMKQVDQLQERTTTAEQKADRLESRLDRATSEADQLRGQLRQMEDQVSRLLERLRALTEAIHDPAATSDPAATLRRLRQMVPLSQNGTGP